MIVGGHCENADGETLRPGGDAYYQLENLGGGSGRTPTWTVKGASTWIPPHSEAAMATDPKTNVCWYFGGYSDTFQQYDFRVGSDGVTAKCNGCTDFYYNSLCRCVDGEWRYVHPARARCRAAQPTPSPSSTPTAPCWSSAATRR